MSWWICSSPPASPSRPASTALERPPDEPRDPPGRRFRRGYPPVVATTQVIRSERFPDLADEVLFPRLSEGKLAWLAERGERLTFEPGEVLYEHAVREAPFYVIERGLVEFVDRKPGKDVYIAQADSHTFIGDIAVFTGEPTLSASVAVEPTDVIAFDRPACATWSRAGPSSASTSSERCWRGARGTRPRGTGSCA